MALTLTLHQGQGFYVGDRRWDVDSYDDEGVGLIGPHKVEGGVIQRVRITEEEATEIEPDVMVSEGFIPDQGCRLVLDAPRKIAILRDDLYEEYEYGDQGPPDASHDPGEKS